MPRGDGPAALAGQVAVVAGASAGIGRAIALELAASGAAVWLLARRGDVLAEVVTEVRERGGGAWPFALDLCRDEEVTRFVERLRSEGTAVDILVHSAGMHALGPIAEAPVADLDAQYRANVRAPYLLTQRLLPMLRARRGQVVFVNSSAGLQAQAQAGAFAATQHALKALADALREEVNGDGVRVLSVFPGRTANPRQERIHVKEGKRYRPERLIQPSDVAALVSRALATDRTAEVTEIRVRPMQKP
jgi:NADP-dependent 3-hydroxy acid dehydrogenase YdfG